MEIQPVAVFHSPLTTKFGVPRQSGVCPALQGRVVFEPAYRKAEAVRGIEAFSHLWLLWGFSANVGATQQLTVRPPRLGGNQRVGVFASRSPFRPNGLALSCVRLVRVETDNTLGPVLHVSGADLMDGTPVYDVKPYLPYADCRPEAIGGFAPAADKRCGVEIPDELLGRLPKDKRNALVSVLAQDPRPQYQNDENRVYGFSFAGYEVKFYFSEGRIKVTDIQKM